MVTHQLQVERRTAKGHRPKTNALPLDHTTNSFECSNYTQSAQAWITQFYLQITPRLPFLHVRSPDVATTATAAADIQLQQTVGQRQTNMKENDNTRGCLFCEQITVKQEKLECGSMPNVTVALSNIGGVLCSRLQRLADAHY